MHNGIENTLFSDMLGINLLYGTRILCVGDIYFSSIDKIFSATCPGGDTEVVFG